MGRTSLCTAETAAGDRCQPGSESDLECGHDTSLHKSVIAALVLVGDHLQLLRAASRGVKVASGQREGRGPCQNFAALRSSSTSSQALRPEGTEPLRQVGGDHCEELRASRPYIDRTQSSGDYLQAEGGAGTQFCGQPVVALKGLFARGPGLSVLHRQIGTADGEPALPPLGQSGRKGASTGLHPFSNMQLPLQRSAPPRLRHNGEPDVRPVVGLGSSAPVTGLLPKLASAKDAGYADVQFDRHQL